MNFLRKILLTAVFVLIADVSGVRLPAPPVAAATIGGNVLDFDTIANINDNVPAMFQPKIYEPAGYQADGPNNLRYVYFTIFNPGEVEDGRFMRAVRRNPNLDDNNIYFPADGSQPTTPDAVNYSLANIDNRENSPITEWYMMMFGVIPINHAAIAAAGGVGAPAPIYVQAGWTNPDIPVLPVAEPVIRFFQHCLGGMNHINCRGVDNIADHRINDPLIPNTQIDRRVLFEREFRKIASTSVGRVLLYRILIEIRRHHQGGNSGCTEDPSYVVDYIQNNDRNSCRSIEIWYDPSKMFLPGFLKFNNSEDQLTVIGKSHIGGYTSIVYAACPIDVAIFHEMVHWFQILRNKNRDDLEFNGDDSGNELKLRTSSIGLYYWSNLDCCLTEWNEERENAYRVKWGGGMMWHNNINFAEMRVLLGSSSIGSMQGYIQGDDLSENLYRMCVGVPLRFGYSCTPYYEDRKVINRAINTSISSLLFYAKGYNGTIGFPYTTRNGLGKCKIN